jgi:eukaryotic-like serine/threonine-protein kinase
MRSSVSRHLQGLNGRHPGYLKLVASEAPLPARYERARLTAHGGMGDIYVAHDRVLKRDVAVKLLLERFAADHDLRERFKREGLAAARLSGHPHVVTIFDVGEWSGRPFIVMEYLQGGTLEARLRGAPVSPPQAIEWLAEAADALDAAHAEGIVHRDVKPANLLFDSRELLRVGDFGIARVLDDSAGLTLTGTVLGTTGYISPEQAQGLPATAASDVYSLAAVAYELLTGSRPFERKSSTAEAAAHVHEAPPRASERNPPLPPEVDGVFERALAKDPKARQATAGQLVADLRRALEAPEEQTTRLLPLPPPVRVNRRPSLRRLVAIGLVAALLAAAGIAAGTIMATGGGDNVRTIVEHRTVTTRGKAEVRRVTVTQTVEPKAPPPPPPATNGPAGAGGSAGTSGSALSLQGYQLMQNGQYSQALPILQRAARALSGTYSQSFPYEAYNAYNLGYTLLQLGDCGGALQWLNRSQELQGHRTEIDAARAQAAACLSPSSGAGAGNGHGNGHGRGKAKGKDNGD